MIDFVQVGLKIMTYRKKQKLTQDELAEMLFVSRQALSKWELGLSIPSIDTLIDLSKIFKVSIDDLLLLDEKDEIDENDLFTGHSREYIVNKISTGSLKVDLPNIFYQFSPQERMIILKGVKEGKVKVSFDELSIRLTDSERRFLIGEKKNV